MNTTDPAEQLSRRILDALTEAGEALDRWALSEAQITVLTERRCRFDTALDTRAAHYLSSLYLSDRNGPRNTFSVSWCSTHRGWVDLAGFAIDRRQACGVQASCRSCQSTRRKARYATHRTEELTRRAHWRAEDGNAARDNARRSEHARAFPEQEAARKRRRNEAVRNGQFVAKGQQTWFERDKRRLRDRLRHRCQGCGDPVPSRQAFDHIFPYAQGGQDRPGNLWLLCTSCNSSKRDLTWMQWRMWRCRRGLTEVVSAKPLPRPPLP